MNQIRLIKFRKKRLFRKKTFKFNLLAYPLLSFLNWSKLIFVYDELTKNKSMTAKAASMKNRAETMLNELLTENIP